MASCLHLGTAIRSVFRTPRSLLRLPNFTPVMTSGRCSGHLAAKNESPDNFTPIYKFPYVVQAYVLCRLKLYQTCITVIMVPGSVALNSAGMVSLQQCQISIAVSMIACAVLYVMGSFFRRLVGIMYVNGSRDTLKISHLTFMGNRRNTLVPIRDVVPLADTGITAPNVVYYPLRLYTSKKEYYYFILRFGGILQPDLFKLVFGEEALTKTPQKFD